MFAHRDIVGAWPVIRKQGWSFVPAPTTVKPIAPGKTFVAASFADVLGVSGYDSADTLLPLVRAWDGLLDRVRPDLVVTDFAPTLGLVAAGRVPVVDIGHGFTQPPTHLGAFPPFVDDHPPNFPPETLLAAVREVQRVRGRPEPATLPEIYAGVEPCLCCLPEFDPFADARPGKHLGSLEPLPAPQPWPNRAAYFAYLSAEVTSTEPVLTLLAKSGFAGSAFVRGADAPMKARLRAAGATVFDDPPPLPEMLARVRVVVHHASLNTAQAALAAGRPQLVFPEHLEHMLYAAAIFDLGVGHSLSREFPAADVVEGMRQLLHEPRFATRAAEVAEKLQRTGPWDALPKVLEACERHLGL